MQDNKTFLNKKLELQNIEQIINVKNNPAVKMTIINLMKSIPILGDLLDNTIDIILSSFQQKKRDEFIDIILKKANITKVMVNDVDFIMEFAKTLEAVNKVTVNEKVKYFAYLFSNSYCINEKIETDEYDEYLRILEDLSLREIQYLCFLKEFELINNSNGNRDKYSKYWYRFMDKFSVDFGLNKYDSYAIYKRLIRSGLVDKSIKYNGSIEKSGQSEYESDYNISFIEDDLEYFYTTDYFNKLYLRLS